jgi:hypothetical protein
LRRGLATDRKRQRATKALGGLTCGGNFKAEKYEPRYRELKRSHSLYPFSI